MKIMSAYQLDVLYSTRSTRTGESIADLYDAVKNDSKTVKGNLQVVMTSNTSVLNSCGDMSCREVVCYYFKYMKETLSMVGRYLGIFKLTWYSNGQQGFAKNSTELKQVTTILDGMLGYINCTYKIEDLDSNHVIINFYLTKNSDILALTLLLLIFRSLVSKILSDELEKVKLVDSLSSWKVLYSLIKDRKINFSCGYDFDMFSYLLFTYHMIEDGGILSYIGNGVHSAISYKNNTSIINNMLSGWSLETLNLWKNQIPSWAVLQYNYYISKLSK